MKNDVTLKLAASGLLIGLTVVGCSPFGGMRGPSTLSSHAPKAGQQASELYAKAAAQVRKGDYAAALPLAERAVELSPRDVAYRMVLADLYVKNGRFQSAEATYGDVLALNPDNQRAALSRALAQIAVGNKAAAMATLDRLALTAPAGDVGLAFALAGDPQRAIALLEPAARANGADGRVRQNLALSYALAGNWQKAHATAAQDVSPAELRTRLQQWAVFAQPRTSFDQVASLLGVSPAEDPGQPTQLALVTTAPQPVAFATSAAAPEEPAPQPQAVVSAAAEAPVPAPQPVQAAAIETQVPVSQPVQQAAVAEAPAPAEPAVEPAVQVQYAAAAQTLVTPEPAVIAAPAAPYKTPIRAFEPAKPAPKVKPAVALRTPSAAPSRYVVQIGAYRSQIAIDRAWSDAQRRYGLGSEDRALTTTISMPGQGVLHRLSVSGFETRGDATRLCEAIQAKGGSCFVRATAGDAPVQWAALRQRSRSA